MPPELDDLTSVEAIPQLVTIGNQIRKAKTEAALQKDLGINVSTLLDATGIAPGTTIDDRAGQLDAELQRCRERTFPVDRFARSPLTAWSGPPDDFFKTTDNFIAERAKINAEARRLVELFQAALLLTASPGEYESVDCPLCGATGTLTNERIIFIRAQLATSAAYTAAAAAATTALAALGGQLDALGQAIDKARPRFMRETSASRRLAGFTVAKIGALLGDVEHAKAWLNAVRPLSRAAQGAKCQVEATRAQLEAAQNDLDQWFGLETLAETLLRIGVAHTQLEKSLATYDSPAKEVGAAIKTAVDQSADTKGWEALIRLCRHPLELWKALTVTAAHLLKIKMLEKSLSDIDKANGEVADSKFTDLTAGIRYWWDLLRPNEASYFEAVQRRSGKTRRTIDLKVGLCASEDRSNVKIRDAIAVFSQSQIYCLGLAMFLARAMQENVGFVILDDPVLTSDDDYRPNFVSSTIEGLLNAGVQVIVCTQDHKSWKDIGDRWGCRGGLQFQIIRNDPLVGSEIRSQNDDLATMIAKAHPFVKSQDPVVRKEGASRVREAIERFAKILITRERQKSGDLLASITDYDGKNFGTYAQRAMALLNKDPSHAGKLKATHAYVTPGPHDDKPPSSGELTLAFGDLKRFKKDYLDT